jgi:hypothetical protein
MARAYRQRGYAIHMFRQASTAMSRCCRTAGIGSFLTLIEPRG